MPLAEYIVRIGREIFVFGYLNGHAETLQMQVRKPEGAQNVPVHEERNSEYERHIV